MYRVQNCRYEEAETHEDGVGGTKKKKRKRSQKQNLDDLKREMEMVGFTFLFVLCVIKVWVNYPPPISTGVRVLSLGVAHCGSVCLWVRPLTWSNLFQVQTAIFQFRGRVCC